MARIIAEFELVSNPQEAAEHVFKQEMKFRGYTRGNMIQRGWDKSTDPPTPDPSKDQYATPHIHFIRIVK